MIQTAYALKGWGIEPDVPRLQRPFVRLTKDIDLFQKRTWPMRAVYAALAEFGASLQGIRPEDFADRSTLLPVVHCLDSTRQSRDV
jgi:hypothetical protein